MVALENIGGESCEPVAGLDKIYYALQSDFVTINDPKKLCDIVEGNVAGSYAELAEIAEAHVFKPGKSFFQIESITQTGNIKSAQIGELGRGLFQNDLVAEVAGSDAKTLGFYRWLKNQKLIVLVQEFGTGNVRQLGSSRLAATATTEHAIEATIEGKNSGTITFTDKNFGPSPIYKGEILLVPVP